MIPFRAAAGIGVQRTLISVELMLYDDTSPGGAPGTECQTGVKEAMLQIFSISLNSQNIYICVAGDLQITAHF